MVVAITIDFEVFSELDITKVGLYNYATHPSTDIICMAWRVHGEADTKIWIPKEEPMPLEFMDVELCMRWVLYAHNANFEKAILEHIGIPRYGMSKPSRYVCTAAQAARMALPRSLEKVSAALSLPVQKDTSGRGAMLRVTKPRKPSKLNDETTWFFDKEKMQTTYDYCKTDVDVDILVGERTHPLSTFERAVFEMDRDINERGVYFDRELAEAAVEVHSQLMAQLDAEMNVLTNYTVDSCTKVLALKEFLLSEGLALDSVNKESLRDALESDISPKARKAIELRQEGGKTSVAKYKKMLAYAGKDDYIRHIFLYHGATTGRWTGKGPQLHNLPQGAKLPISKDEAIALIKTKDLLRIQEQLPNVSEALSSCIRECLMASPGHTLIAGDFKNIEVRVLAWLADETQLLELLRRGEDPYIDMAADIYTTDIPDVSKDQRQVGKFAVLGLGYGMGANAFQTQCATRGVEIESDFANDVKLAYRRKFKKIIKFWKTIEKAMLEALRFKTSVDVDKLTVFYFGGRLLIRLPNGRHLYYNEPRIEKGDFKEDIITCMTVDSQTKQWVRRKIYGGLLAENVTQAVARDLLAEAMLQLEHWGYNIVLHVHDEAVVEETEDFETNEDHVSDVMSEVPHWAAGCPIEVETWSQRRYQKG